MRRPPTRYLTTADGVHLAWCEAGGGKPLLYLPATTLSHCQLEWEHEYWTDWYEALIGAGRRLIRYDERGVGLSDRDAPLSAESRVLDLEAIADHLGLDAFDVLAVSSAAEFAVEFAARHPGRVGHMVLWAPVVNRGDRPAIVETLKDLATVDWPLFAKTVMGLGSQDNYDDEITRAAASLWQQACDGPTFLQYEEMITGGDLFDRLAAVSCPTLVIHPRALEWPPMDVSRRTAGALPDSSFVIVGGGDIRPQREEIAAVAAVIAGFLDGAPSFESRATTEGVRTVLSTDLVGHAEFMHRLGDEAGRDVLREHERIVRNTLRTHGGTEVKTMGDGFLTWFVSTAAAISCACDLQRACAARNATAAEPFHIRIGLSAGEPVDDDGDIFGETVILASRVMAQAGADEIMVADHVRHLAAGKGFSFQPRGDFKPKGYDEPIAVFAVDWDAG